MRLALLTLVAIVLLGCSENEAPAPPEQRGQLSDDVSVTVAGGDRIAVPLPPKARASFLRMMEEDPTTQPADQWRQATAAPVGYFIVADRSYEWHGQGVLFEGPEASSVVRSWNGELPAYLLFHGESDETGFPTAESLRAALAQFEASATATTTTKASP